MSSPLGYWILNTEHWILNIEILNFELWTLNIEHVSIRRKNMVLGINGDSIDHSDIFAPAIVETPYAAQICQQTAIKTIKS